MYGMTLTDRIRRIATILLAVILAVSFFVPLAAYRKICISNGLIRTVSMPNSSNSAAPKKNRCSS